MKQSNTTLVHTGISLLTVVAPMTLAEEQSHGDQHASANARTISNAISLQAESIENRRGATNFLWQWGQFLDHDITEGLEMEPD